MDTAGIMGLLGRSGIYISPVHFAATYASATTLTLAGAGLPAITDDSQIIGVVEFPSGTARHEWKSAREYATSYAAGTLTMTGAAFANGSLFMVFVAGPHHLDADLAALLAEIQSAIEDHGTALSDDAVVKVGAEAVSGTPAALADGEVARFATDLTRSLRAHLSQGLDKTTSSVENWEKPGTGFDTLAVDLAAAGTAYQLTATSTPCWGVWLSGVQANAGQSRWGDSAIAAIGTGGAYIPHDDASPPIWVPIDDARKVYCVGSNNGDDVIATVLLRS